MRMSCNGCRVLRKGCSENCSIRPCLVWIKSSEAQANATVFLAKFYGRAGLMNLINAGPDHLRPAIFRSLLYEACGRIVNPIYGSVGLLWSGSWQLCQAAVESVLKGLPITPIASETAADGQCPPLKAYDIRHVSKDETSGVSNDQQNNRVKSRVRAKRCSKPKENCCSGGGGGAAAADDSASHDSSLSHQSELAVGTVVVETESTVSGDERENKKKSTATGTAAAVVGGVGLELSLGFEPVSRCDHVMPVKKRRIGTCEEEEATCRVELGLGCRS